MLRKGTVEITQILLYKLFSHIILTDGSVFGTYRLFCVSYRFIRN